MRISDWSSDVCSSDLHQLNLEPALEIEQRFLRHRQIGVVDRAGQRRDAARFVALRDVDVEQQVFVWLDIRADAPGCVLFIEREMRIAGLQIGRRIDWAAVGVGSSVQRDAAADGDLRYHDAGAVDAQTGKNTLSGIEARKSTSMNSS